MGHRFSEITFTPSVERVQKQFGSYERSSAVRQRMPVFDRFESREREFISSRDSFYMASVSETGWPYIQHRGGDMGFLKVLDSQTLAFINFTGNGQYQSLGNLAHNDRVALFLMDYPNRRRLKILGMARMLSGDQITDELVQCLHIDKHMQKFESVITVQLEAFDWNCSQHITPRFSTSELEAFEAIR
ncbi:pyridoxamine 5'-phosphate oxidase family protein [Neptuniibacter caesariensis]|uniref:Pyridoxamine 5'-phosphate oxidase/oxidoreductase, NAD-dependent n=1 Tax=Neptuniibacter caesariensis TaxID=207954 RepID=A0A7U8GTV2_NEPCE|nr:pyridoxamine 5'-phosphate oxidase family protein [Neptuniibacter caesariensis]EAR62515.1 pyridoxamine 5'-phosphate oxidase/oxidoreductase, NAD-dependent [Oceanospirillum sp. MED92] [Neptuniibacter caesariensis]